MEHRLPGAISTSPCASARRAHQPPGCRRRQPPRRPADRSVSLPVSVPARIGCRHGDLRTRGRCRAAHLLRQGRLPVGGRLLGRTGLAGVGEPDQQGAAASRYPIVDLSPGAPVVARAVRGEGGAADSEHQPLAPQRRRNQRARARERRAGHQGDQRSPRPHPCPDDARHRYLGLVGAGGRGAGGTSTSSRRMATRWRSTP